VDRLELHDPRVLRAIAHPVRNRILTELDAHGPLRAADVAVLLGIPANSASFHLRQLAKFRLVEEDPDAARDKRDRVWRLNDEADQDISLGEVEKMPGGKAASAVFRRNKAAWGRRIVDAAFTDDRTPGRQIAVAEQPLQLTKVEAEELSHRLVDLVKEYKSQLPDTDADRRTYLVYQIVVPYLEVEG
jgi:predicted ArsR family transcriptional regulator